MLCSTSYTIGGRAWEISNFRNHGDNYHIAGKFGEEFNLVVWWTDRPTAKLKSANVKLCDIARNVACCRCLPNFVLMPVGANPPNFPAIR